MSENHTNKFNRFKINNKLLEHNKDLIEKVLNDYFDVNTELKYTKIGSKDDFEGIDCVFNNKNFAIRCRSKVYEKYGDIVIRMDRGGVNGQYKSEYEKIKEGIYKAEYYLNIYYDEKSRNIVSIYLYDVNNIQKFIINVIENKTAKKYIKSNRYINSMFMCVNTKKECIFKCSNV